MNTPIESSTYGQTWQIGDWQLDPLSGDLRGPAGQLRLEPKLLDLLRLLADAEGSVVSQEQLLASLWPGVIVGEDTVARSVSRLRRALGDDARAPTYIETLSKRGYRLCVPVLRSGSPPAPAPAAEAGVATPPRPLGFRAPAAWALALCAFGLAAAVLLWTTTRDEHIAPVGEAAVEPEDALLARAHDHYAQYQYPDNEAALQLYERVLALRPDHPPALAGLANALVQKAMRWPSGSGPGPQFQRLRDALAAGHLQQPAQVRLLQRARRLAERALEHDPTSTLALRAYGLASSAQSDFDTALDAYRRALAVDPDAWGVLINLADVLELTGHPDEALPYYEAAYAAMDRVYAKESARIRPWHASLGVLIGDRYRQAQQLTEAEAWYRQVLRTTPLEPDATRALAAVLRTQGDADQANALCADLASTGETCEAQP